MSESLLVRLAVAKFCKDLIQRYKDGEIHGRDCSAVIGPMLEEQFDSEFSDLSLEDNEC